ncbi:MAG: glycosyltransferase family 1 protein [Bryobacterales bacterium]|nr:glycosyltransferase family 4 protein [Bryobacteraceae bacterium]MDW8354367.1 glycosyltransferase family 1 protein [Bryobacterales bacterium]
MSLSILIDARHLRDFGIGTYIRNLLRALAALDAENRYILVAYREDLSELSGLGPNFQLAPYERRDTDPLDQLAFPWHVRHFSADLCHIPLNVVSIAMPTPYVVTVHDMSSLLFDQQRTLRKNFRRYQFRRGLLRAERVIAVSHATREDIEDLFGVPSERISVVYNAPDPEFLEDTSTREQMEQILERYQVDYPFLLYAGTIRPQKNIPRLIEAFAVARGHLESHPLYRDLRLIIIGDEISRYPAVRRAVIQTRVEQVVRFLGFVPLETLKCFYKAAAAFVFPSLYEGFGLPPLEAMACGTPVVASNVSSLPEVVGDAALLVNPVNVFDIAEKICEVLTNQSLRAELIAKGCQRVRQFSWRHTARQVLDIYHRVALERRRAA